jgi:AAA+ ATPase superfamily predicted ATPase
VVARCPAHLIDRQEELEILRTRALEGRNSRLEAPRRFGKTSILRKVLADVGDEGMIGVYVNFLGVLTAGEVAERIERAYREQLDTTLRRWVDGVVRTLRPTISGPAVGLPVRGSVTPQPVEASLLDRLALPRRLHDKHGRRAVIVFDEFQDVLRAGKGLDGVFRSELEHHSEAAAYVFSGSHPGLMRELFATRRRAFFG